MPGSKLFFRLLLLLCTVHAFACTGGEDEQFVDPEVCDNGADDDGDGLTDCADEDCRQDEACAGEATEHCYDLIDNDFDDKTDCADEECATSIVCVDALESCSSGRDDDNDGLVDCNDDDCAGTASCIQNGEQCSNGADDDGDGDVDCDDSDCASTNLCGQRPERCDTPIDEDGDRTFGCADQDCASTAFCTDGGEHCSNGVDDDEDGRIDCLDTDCAYNHICLGTSEVCNNGIDDDANGLADCQDPHCAGRVRCQVGAEVCDNRIDDDGDGFLDCDDPDCIARGACEVCDNGVDDDGDDSVDCEDADCQARGLCEICGNGRDDDSDGRVDCRDDACADLPACTCDGIFDVNDDCLPDADNDGVPDGQDNCPNTPNPAQETNVNGSGLACVDADSDGIPDARDNCPNIPNPRQIDRDDWLTGQTPVEGDACDTLVDLTDADLDGSYGLLNGNTNFNPAKKILHVGDVNGDGVPDLLSADPAATTKPVRLFFGPFTVGDGGRPVTDADATLRNAADDPSEELGDAVVGLGDVNADGFDDFAVSAPEADAGNGEVYIIFGGPDVSGDLQTSLDVDVTLSLGATRSATRVGEELFAPGDFTGDGVTDLVVQSLAAGGGPEWYFFNSSTLIAGAPRVTVADRWLDRSPTNWSDVSLHLADFDGDGVDDWFAASPGGVGGDGLVEVYKGTADTTNLLNTPIQTFSGDVNGDRLGQGFDFVDGGPTTSGLSFAVSSKATAGQSTALGAVDLYSIAQDGSYSGQEVLPGGLTVAMDGELSVVRDLTAPGSQELLVSSVSSQTAGVTLVFGFEWLGANGSNAPLRHFVLWNGTVGSSTEVIARVDWDGDGYRDLLLASEASDGVGTVWLWPNSWHVDVR